MSVTQRAIHICVSRRFSVFSFSFFNKSLSLSHDHPCFIIFKTRRIAPLSITNKFRALYPAVTIRRWRVCLPIVVGKGDFLAIDITVMATL